MAQLESKRKARQHIEAAAANVIQRVYRGFSLRKNFAKLRKRLLMRNKVRLGMKKVTKGTSLVMEEKERKAQRAAKRKQAAIAIQRRFKRLLSLRVLHKEMRCRREEIHNHMATKIQTICRGALAVVVVQKLRRQWMEEVANGAALQVQRLVRGRLDRKRIQRLRCDLENMAIYMIQHQFRLHLARKTLIQAQARSHDAQANRNALFIQRHFRGWQGRRRVHQIRHIEKNEIRQAAVLLLQRMARGKQGRRMAREELCRKQTQTQWCALLRLQCLARGFLGKCRFQQVAAAEKNNIFTQTRLGSVDQVDDIFSGFADDKDHGPMDTDAQGNTVLLIAAKWGHKKIVRKCLRWGMDLNHENAKGESALQLAIGHGHDEIAEYLISKKAEINHYGRTLLHEAAKGGLTSIVDSLLTHGIAVDERDSQQVTALAEAARGGHLETVDLLLTRGAEINVQSSDGSTPLHAAASMGNIPMVTELLLKGADISIVDAKERTAWRVALSRGHENCAKELRRRWIQFSGEEADGLATLETTEKVSAIFAAARQGHLQEVEDLLDRGMDIQVCDPQSGNSILMEAAKGGHDKIVQLCKQWGMDLHVENFAGQNALMLAAPFAALAHELVDWGLDVLHTDAKRRCALHECAKYGYTFNEWLSARNVSLDVVDQDGQTPLHEAAKLGDAKLCRQLLNLGAKVQVTDSFGRLPLHYACQMNTGVACTQILVKAGNSPQAADIQHCKTPGHYAAGCGNALALDYLLNMQASVKARDNLGRTPIFDAVQAGSLPCIQLLLERGAKATLMDTASTSLLHLAMETSNDAIVDLILAEKLDALLAESTSQDIPLHRAAAAGHVYGARQLLELNANAVDEMLQKVNGLGDTPLLTAMRHGHAALLPLFQEFHADVKIENTLQGQSLIHVLALSENPAVELIEPLTKTGLSLTAFDAQGNQPIHLAVQSPAAQRGHLEFILALINDGVPINATTKLTGMTPLHCAAQRAVCKLLVENGANIKAESGSERRLAVQLAEGHDETVAYLQSL